MSTDPFSTSRNLSLSSQFVLNLQPGTELFTIMHAAQETVLGHKCNGFIQTQSFGKLKLSKHLCYLFMVPQVKAMIVSQIKTELRIRYFAKNLINCV